MSTTGRQLARSNQRHLVHAAYRAAGLDLTEDLAALAAAPRVRADAGAKAWLDRHAVPRGTTPAPVVTLHNVADAADPAYERWYAERVARRGDPDRVRQLFAGRATHCAFTPAEEIVAMRTLFARVDTGRWPSTAPARLTAVAASFGPEYQTVFDFATFQFLPTAAADTRFSPPVPLRPSRQLVWTIDSFGGTGEESLFLASPARYAPRHGSARLPAVCRNHGGKRLPAGHGRCDGQCR